MLLLKVQFLPSLSRPTMTANSKSDEVIIYSAHRDYSEQGRTDDCGDSIYNGALYMETGTSRSITLSCAFQSMYKKLDPTFNFLQLPPENRSLLIPPITSKPPVFNR